jgi:preprotein translocase subunit YajC
VFISLAYAQAPGGFFGGDLLSSPLPMFVVFGFAIYFLMIRPQQKRAKEIKSMLQALQKGDEVVTAGGIVGKISKLSESYVNVEIAPNVEIAVQRSAISLLLPKGTLKSL